MDHERGTAAPVLMLYCKICPLLESICVFHDKPRVTLSGVRGTVAAFMVGLPRKELSMTLRRYAADAVGAELLLLLLLPMMGLLLPSLRLALICMI